MDFSTYARAEISGWDRKLISERYIAQQILRQLREHPEGDTLPQKLSLPPESLRLWEISSHLHPEVTPIMTQWLLERYQRNRPRHLTSDFTVYHEGKEETFIFDVRGNVSVDEIRLAIASSGRFKIPTLFHLESILQDEHPLDASAHLGDLALDAEYTLQIIPSEEVEAANLAGKSWCVVN